MSEDSYCQQMKVKGQIRDASPEELFRLQQGLLSELALLSAKESELDARRIEARDAHREVEINRDNARDLLQKITRYLMIHAERV